MDHHEAPDRLAHTTATINDLGAAAEADFERSLVRAFSRRSSEELRDAVWSFTDALKEDGVLIEGVIVRLKYAIARSATPFQMLRTRGEPLRTAEEVCSAAVTWCIARFYERE
jgi:hypothetical protein